MYAVKKVKEDTDTEECFARINPKIKEAKEKMQEVQKMKNVFEAYELMNMSYNENLSQLEKIHIKNRLAEIRNNL